MDGTDFQEPSLQQLQSGFFVEYQRLPVSRHVEDVKRWIELDEKILDMTIEEVSEYADYVMERTCSECSPSQFKKMVDQCLSWPSIMKGCMIDSSAIAGFALVCLTAKKRGLDSTPELEKIYKEIIENGVTTSECTC
jgi:hypothetical protein